MASPQTILNSSTAQTKTQFILYFRVGANPYPQTVNFLFNTNNLRDAVSRAQRHCEIMNYRFVSVRPALVDFDEAEKQHLGNI